jgi:hypothetical protein
MASLSTKATTDHECIKKWAEERGAKPACVKGTGDKDDPGLIRIDIPGASGRNKLQHISWEEFFHKFDESHLALVYQDITSKGYKSSYNKIVDREKIMH